MELDINKTCCFTGHRPEKITENVDIIKANLSYEIQKAIDLGYDTFITGMALGTDTWAGEIMLEFKKHNENIKLICAVPFNGVEKNRTPELQKIFHEILDNSDDSHYLSKKYTRWAVLARDEWMVDNSSYVIAVFNGSYGGTQHTLDYAKKMERKISYVNMKELEV